MGILYDLATKKRCTMCGCIMAPDDESSICDCCKDDLTESNPGKPENVESLYPRVIITTNLGLKAIEKFRGIVDRRIEDLRK